MAGAFAFSGLLVYVAGSPIIFMEVFHVSAGTFGAIFAGLSVGFIGSNQINVLLLRKFSSEQIFRGALLVECPAALLFLVGTICGWFGLPATLALLFIALSSLGLAYPNAAALALSPFDNNIGSASAMLGFLQIGVSSLASASIGIFDSHGMLPVTLILAATSWIGLGILVIGRRRISRLRFLEKKKARLRSCIKDRRKMDKAQLIRRIVSSLSESFAALENAARASHAEATHESSKAESKYDTRGLEAAYLAGGQARQAKEILDSIKSCRIRGSKKFCRRRFNWTYRSGDRWKPSRARSIYFIGPSRGRTGC